MLRSSRWFLSLLALLVVPSLSSAQTVLTGRVKSDAQAPVRGAFVGIPALQLSAVTNDNGIYRILVPADRASGTVTVVATSIGYRSAEEQVTLRTGTVTHDFTLAEQAIALDEVVVTGTAGRQERRAQSAVVATVQAARITEVAPVTSVANLLQARTPGVVVRNRSGTTGTGQTILIRGDASINLSSDPLVFIDGIRMQGGNRQIYGVGNQQGSALNDIKIEEIESIEIVKGPAAATLYGSDANAGVINIITKRGRTQSGFTQSVSMEYGQADPNFTPPDNMGTCVAGNATSSAFTACASVPVGTVLVDNPLVRENAFLDGRYRNLTWNLRGGGERYAVFLSVGADDDDGTLPGTAYGHTSGRANFDFFASEKLRMEFGFGVSRAVTDLPTNDNNIYGYLGGGLLGDPRTRGAAKDGWYGPNRQTLAISAHETNDQTLRIQPRTSVVYTPYDWFTNRLTVGGDLVRSRAFSFWAKNNGPWWDAAPLNTGQQGEARQAIDRITFDYLGNITRSITDELRGDFSFGSQILTRRTDLTSAQGTGLINNDVRDVNSAAQLTGGGQSASEERSVGFFSQAQFTWRDKLYVQLGARVDQASAFGADSEPFFSPKVGVSYVISEENFFRNLVGDNTISLLRLRAAYGVTGRQPTSGARSTFNPTTNQISPTVLVVGVNPGATGNVNLRAEKGHEFEAGFDAAFLQDRLGLEVTYFNKQTKDLILSQPVPGSQGSSSPQLNVGALLNRGFEVAANTRILTYENLAWEVRGALNTLHNEVLDLGDTPETATRKVGFPINGSWQYGIRSVDVANNRVIISDTLEFLGNSPNLPGWEATLSTTITLFRDLSLYLQGDGRGDRLVYNNTDQFRDRQNGFSPIAVLGCGAFRADQTSANCTDDEKARYMRKFGPWLTETWTDPETGQQRGGRTLSRTTVQGDYLEDGTFFKLREASLNYRLPRDFTTRYMKVQTASLTVAMRNLRTWTDFTGLDPESDQFLTVPQDRRWTVRFNFTY